MVAFWFCFVVAHLGGVLVFVGMPHHGYTLLMLWYHIMVAHSCFRWHIVVACYCIGGT